MSRMPQSQFPRVIFPAALELPPTVQIDMTPLVVDLLERQRR